MAKKPTKDDIADVLGVDPDADGGPEVLQPQPEPPKPEPVAEAPAEPVAEVFDSVLDAHKRRQENWEADAARLFKGPTVEQQEREQLLNALSAKDAEDIKERRKADEAREAQLAEEAKAARQKRAAELRAEAEALEKA
jgi:hypothetical protein